MSLPSGVSSTKLPAGPSSSLVPAGAGFSGVRSSCASPEKASPARMALRSSMDRVNIATRRRLCEALVAPFFEPPHGRLLFIRTACRGVADNDWSRRNPPGRRGKFGFSLHHISTPQDNSPSAGQCRHSPSPRRLQVVWHRTHHHQPLCPALLSRAGDRLPPPPIAATPLLLPCVAEVGLWVWSMPHERRHDLRFPARLCSALAFFPSAPTLPPPSPMSYQTSPHALPHPPGGARAAVFLFADAAGLSAPFAACSVSLASAAAAACSRRCLFRC